MFSEYDFHVRTTVQRIALTALVTVMILFGTHTHLISFAAFVICSAVLIFDKSSFGLMLMSYLLLMAHVFMISPTGQSYFTFLMFIYIGVQLFREKKILISVVFLIIYIVIVQAANHNFSFNDDMKLFGNIMFIGYAVGCIKTCSDKEKDTICLYYIAAIISSSVMRFFDSPFFPISDYNKMKTEGFGGESEKIVRFSGLYNDPNYYSVNLIIGLCLLVVLFYKGKVHPLICALLAGTLIYFGTLTYSKSFILMMILPLVLLLYANGRSGRKGAQILSVFLIIGGIILLMTSNADYFLTLQRRLDTGTSLMTGRDNIWAIYMEYIFEHPWVALFGAGIGAELPVVYAMHNVYIEILYHLGLFGGGLLIYVFVESGYPHRNGKKKNLLNFSVLIAVLVMYAWLSQLHDYEFPIHFMLAYMILLTWDAQPNQVGNQEPVFIPLLPELADNKVRVLMPRGEE